MAVTAGDAAALVVPNGRGAVAPGPRYRTPFGLVSDIRRDPLGYTVGLFRRYGDVVCLPMGPFTSYMVFHPDALKHVLQEHNQNYVKGVVIAKVKILIGEGLFTSEGDFWRRQRRLAQPAFHRQRIANFARLMQDCTAAMLDGWAPRAGRQVPFDVAAEMSRLTLQIVGKALFSMDLAGEAGAVGRALMTALEYLGRRAMSFVPWPAFLPTPGNVRFLRARHALDRVVYRIIETRRRTGEDAGDFLGMMLAARDEGTGEGMSDRQLRDEVMTFLLAGHETTAVALTWACYLLEQHPEVEARLRAEVAAAIGDRAPTLDDLPALRYARMVLEETMRLYPPVWGISRQAIGDDTIGGYHIRANAPVSMSPFVTHRHPEFWDDPERFDPERFTPERVAARHRFAYLPFSGGPRLCIGNEFALMEGTIVLAMLVQRYRLARASEGPVGYEATLTLRPKGGMPMTLASA